MSKQQGKLFIVSGPSGVGKTTLVLNFLQRYQHLYTMHRVVTYTTKCPRATEVDGIDYDFISESEFKDNIERDFFLEWSGEYGALYGTPRSIIDDLALGLSKILVIDRAGAAQIVSKYPKVVLIWIEVSSIDVLSDRLIGRKTESYDQVQSRLSLACKEILQEKNESMYHYYIKNDDLKDAITRLFDVVSICHGM